MDYPILKISIIIPFYNGNNYMSRIFTSITNVVDTLKKSKREESKKIEFEIVLVNDSPDIEVQLPDDVNDLDVKVYCNERNMGIQKTRVNGLNHATGEWILFLDQDDELVAEGFERQIELTKKADVIVGNGLYQYSDQLIQIYKNRSTMEYLIKKKRFIEIRNLIPSPGECLIKKKVIPETWKNSPIKSNGADDWFLWLLLFQKECVFKCNEKVVYIHNNAEGQNLSLNIDKMYDSAIEMLEVLKDKKINQTNVTFSKQELKSLEMAIKFKYLKDTRCLKIADLIKFRKALINNIIYKLILKIRE